MISVLLIAAGFFALSCIHSTAAFIFIAISLIIFLLFVFITYKRIKEVHEMSDYISHISNGEYDLDIKDNKEGELSILKNNLYKIIVTLRSQQELLCKDKNYLADSLADISHQLKTPITSITMMTDLLKNETDEEKRREFTEVINSQLSRVNWLIVTLLKLSKIDAGVIEFENTNESTFMEILKVQNLTKTYGKGDVMVKALDDVSFSVPKGQFVAIVGPSGSGKSTLLHILGGVDTATSGHVFIEGTDISKLDENALAIFRRRQIGLIYQFYNLIPILNVEENITLPILLDGQSVNKKKLDLLVDSLGLKGRVKHLPSQLSGGQQQRVSIGRALMNNPALVLADEPTGNLDSKNSAEIVDLLRTINRENNQTVIIITHDDRIAMSADRIIAIEDGKIVKDEVIRQ